MSKTDLDTLASMIHGTHKRAKPGEHFQHIKSGALYKVSEISFREEDLIFWVTYKPIEDPTGLVAFGRTLEEFLSRFEPIPRRVPEGKA